jgi:hypothetical protein
MEIFGFGKTLFGEFIPCVEVTFVSKFHPIWCPIAPESRMERNGWILKEFHVFQRPPAGHCMAQPDNVWLSQTLSDSQFQLDVRSPFWSYFSNWVSN